MTLDDFNVLMLLLGLSRTPPTGGGRPYSYRRDSNLMTPYNIVVRCLTRTSGVEVVVKYDLDSPSGSWYGSKTLSLDDAGKFVSQFCARYPLGYTGPPGDPRGL